MTVIEALRWANLAIWGALFGYMVLAGALTALGKTPRRGDPMRLGTALVALLFVLGIGRWLFAPENTILLTGIHALSAGVGLYIIMLARAYGRGPRL